MDSSSFRTVAMMLTVGNIRVETERDGEGRLYRGTPTGDRKSLQKAEPVVVATPADHQNLWCAQIARFSTKKRQFSSKSDGFSVY